MNRLVRINTNGGQGITYVYDGDGHRVKKTTAQGTVNYFYDGSSEVAETDGAGNVLNSFDPGISVTDQQGTKLFYLYNGHGDVAGLMDVNQNLVQSYEYDAFGSTLGVQKDPNHSRYVGSGGVYSDDDASLQNMWNRWYDPKIGRFISRDPIGMAGGMNLYVYAKNNPICLSDFTGLCSGIQISVDVGFLGTNLNINLLDLGYNGSLHGDVQSSFTGTPTLLGADVNFHYDTSTIIPAGMSVYASPAFTALPLGKYLSVGADSKGGNISIGAGLGSPIGASVDIKPSTPIFMNSTLNDETRNDTLWNS